MIAYQTMDKKGANISAKQQTKQLVCCMVAQMIRKTGIDQSAWRGEGKGTRNRILKAVLDRMPNDAQILLQEFYAARVRALPPPPSLSPRLTSDAKG